MDEEINRKNTDYIFRFRNNNKYTIDEIKNNYIFFADRNSLNDPFDSLPDLIKLTDNEQENDNFYKIILNNAKDNFQKDYIEKKMNPQILNEFAKTKLNSFISKFGIACFSMYFENLPMWANYANNYNGLCLQYQISYDKIFFTDLKPITYKELNTQEIAIHSEFEKMMSLFYTKSKQWSYEKEIRLLKFKKGKISHKKEVLRNIILGYNASTNFKKNVCNAVKSNYQNVSVFLLEKPTIINEFRLIKIL